jgi:hypothetical protein
MKIILGINSTITGEYVFSKINISTVIVFQSYKLLLLKS